MIYSALGRLIPQRDVTSTPRRIIVIRTCCIGDVVMATAALSALREAFPQAHISFSAGSWSARAIADHPALDALIDTGEAALPTRSPREFLRFLRQLRAGGFDLAISLTRSPLMSMAVYLSGIPLRAGLDSAGRGFGYNLRVPVDPAAREHESAIYLRVISAIAGRPCQAYANLPVDPAAQDDIRRRLKAESVSGSFIVAHPGGGSNPGMTMDSKRYPPAQLADLLDRLARETTAALILIGGPGDEEAVGVLGQRLSAPAIAWVNQLNFAQIAALAAGSLCYIGNDTGMTHLAAAAGAATVMMMGPSDPQRYAPFTENHLVLWKATDLKTGGVGEAPGSGWDWARDGFSAEDGARQILEFLQGIEPRGRLL
ncbi:MAG: glycosyltransferase family 9 protein [Chloroflexota bacterium]|nr:glycosyltransferase family 9 protein [Chloroflexota bacterium]